MLKRRLAMLAGAACLALATESYGLRGWSDVFPPLSVEDVDAIGKAADEVDLAMRGGTGDDTASFENPRTGTFGTVQGLGETERGGFTCRNYRLFIKVKGYEPFHVEPVMCKVDSGRWKFASGLQ